MAGQSPGITPGFGDLPERACRARQGQGPLRILHFGDSHVAADPSRQTYGALFRGWAGSGGGAGYGLPPTGAKLRQSSGWRRPRKDDGLRGLGGSFLEASTSGAWVALEGSFSRLRLHFLRQPGGGRALVQVDGRPLGEVDLRGESGLALFSRDLVSRAHRLEIRILEGTVRFLGAALEEGPGAAYSPLGLNGAKAVWLLDLPEPLLAAQLRAEAPDLVILAFGTNEAMETRLDVEAYGRSLETVLGRLRRAVPQAALLMVGPPDGRVRGPLAEVVACQRRVAAAWAVPFADQRQAMGGPGAVARWSAEGLMRPDLIHLGREGYDRLARAVFGATLGPAPVEGPAPPATSRPIYSFRAEDGRLFITDNPEVVRGIPGQWIGKAPR